MTQKLAHTIQNLKISLLTALNSHFLKVYQTMKPLSRSSKMKQILEKSATVMKTEHFFLKLQNPNYSDKRHLQSKTRYLTHRTRVSWCKISIISPLNLSNLAKIIIPNTEKLNYGRALKTNALDWIMDIRVNRILAWSCKVDM